MIAAYNERTAGSPGVSPLIRNDVKTGKAVQLPAVVDIPAYPVQVRDEMILLGIPKE
jgi:hypothetical protein